MRFSPDLKPSRPESYFQICGCNGSRARVRAPAERKRRRGNRELQVKARGASSGVRRVRTPVCHRSQRSPRGLQRSSLPAPRGGRRWHRRRSPGSDRDPRLARPRSVSTADSGAGSSTADRGEAGPPSALRPPPACLPPYLHALPSLPAHRPSCLPAPLSPLCHPHGAGRRGGPAAHKGVGGAGAPERDVPAGRRPAAPAQPRRAAQGELRSAGEPPPAMPGRPHGLFSPQTLKPLLEKRRRARINESLNQLKTLILPLVCKDVSAAARPCAPRSSPRPPHVALSPSDTSPLPMPTRPSRCPVPTVVPHRSPCTPSWRRRTSWR